MNDPSGRAQVHWTIASRSHLEHILGHWLVLLQLVCSGLLFLSRPVLRTRITPALSAGQPTRVSSARHCAPRLFGKANSIMKSSRMPCLSSTDLATMDPSRRIQKQGKPHTHAAEHGRLPNDKASVTQRNGESRQNLVQRVVIPHSSHLRLYCELYLVVEFPVLVDSNSLQFTLLRCGDDELMLHAFAQCA